MGYDSGFGNGNLANGQSNGLSDTHFIGGNLDLWNTENTLLQVTIARAFDVTDGFDGLTVFSTNPLTGETGLPPAVLRFTPTKNLGAIDLAGVVFQQRRGRFDCSGASTGPGSALSTSPDLLVDSFRIRLALRSTTMGTWFMQALATTSRITPHQGGLRVQSWIEVLVQFRPGTR